MFINGLFKSSFFDRAGGFNETPPSASPPGMMPALEAVVPFEEVTKTSTGTGDWNVAGTWTPLGVPGANDKVRIVSGHTVTVKGNNTARVEWCRVEGTMNFDTAADSKLTVGTLFVLDGGALHIGTRASPLPSSVTAEIVIADLGALDLTKDTWKLGRGILTTGTCEFKMYGAAKTPFVKLGADMATSATSATLASAPTGWAVGDECVIGADNYQGWRTYPNEPYWRWDRTNDEEVTLTSVSGTSIGWTGGTTYTHSSPTGRSDLKPVVANLSRNIKIYTENPTTVPDDSGNTNGLRGHIMIMGNPDFDMRYVELRDLGRTNKSIRAIEAVDQLATGVMATTTNVLGRYALHFHFTGTTDAKLLAAPKVFGCVAAGSASTGFLPGWGFAQHGSCGNWWGNVAYRVFGSAFTAENGDERGIWRDCLALTTQGYLPTTTKNAVDGDSEDGGNNGSGFFLTARFVRLVGCKAVSCQFGFDAFHRWSSEAGVRSIDLDITEIRPLFYGDKGQGGGGAEGYTTIDAPSIRHWTDLEAIGCMRGMQIEKAAASWPNEKQTILKDITIWNRLGPERHSLCAGAAFAYTGGYILDNFDVVNVKDPNGRLEGGKGMIIGQNSWRITILNSTINGATDGIAVSETSTHAGGIAKPANADHVIYNNTFLNIDLEDIKANTSAGETEIVTTPPESAFSVDTGLSGSSLDYKTFGDPFGTATDFFGSYDWGEGIIWNADDLTAFYTQYESWTDGADKKLFMPMMWTDRGRNEDHMDVVNLTLNGTEAGGAGGSGAVNSPNTAPSVTSFSTTATANTSTSDITTTTLDLATLASVSDANGDTPLYYFVNSTDNIQIVNEDDSNGTIKLIPDVGYTGTDSFKFWVWDGQSGITEGTCTVTVE